MLLGALEGGGTKMVCAVGDENGRIIDRISIPTESPEVTMPKIIAYFKEQGISALGIAFFGPLDLNKNSKTYGYITATNKTEWQFYNVLGTLSEALQVPCALDTDVNGSALGEASFGCMQGVKNGIYITVGTGVGTGILSNGVLLHGMMHPEGGHVFINRHPEDTFEGMCAFHGGMCLEGMAAGPAIEKRAGKKAVLLSPDDKIWEFESYYIAQAICNYIMILSPEKIVLGGGVMKQTHLFEMIRRDVVRLLGDYIKTEQLSNIDEYIVPASLNDNQAVMGCMKLAYDAAVVS